MREKEQLKRQEDQEEARLTRLQAERDALLVLGLETLSSQQKKRLNAVLDEREAIWDRRERRRVVAKRKRKKRRKKKTPKTSSSRGRARRRQRQCHTLSQLVIVVSFFFTLCFTRSSTGLRCLASWPVWSRRTVAVVCTIAGIAGDFCSSHCVRLPWLAGPEMLGILAGMDQNDGCPWHGQCWYCW